MGIRIHYDNVEKFYDFSPIPYEKPPVAGGESGVAIEVAELPTPSAETVGKVYKVGENYYVGDESSDFVVGEPLGDKIYFDTSVNIVDLGIQPGAMVTLLEAHSDSYDFTMMAAEMLGGEQGTCYTVICGDLNTNVPSLIYVQCDALTVDQFNEMFGPRGFPTITKFGWQTDVLDTTEYIDCLITKNHLHKNGNIAYKEKGFIFKTFDETGTPIKVATLPAPTKQDVGKVYLNTTDGEYYLGAESKVGWGEDEQVSIICFDTSADIQEIMKDVPAEEDVELFTLTDGYGNTGGLCLTYLKIDLSQMGNEGYLYIISPFDAPPYVYLYCDVLTVEQFNETLASEMGIPPIQAFGWQMEDCNILPYDNGGYIFISTNQLPNGQPFVHKYKSYVLQKLVKEQ